MISTVRAPLARTCTTRCSPVPLTSSTGRARSARLRAGLGSKKRIPTATQLAASAPRTKSFGSLETDTVHARVSPVQKAAVATTIGS